MLKKIIITLSIIFGIFVLVVAGGFIYLLHGNKEVLNLEINPIVLDNIEDGTYKGEFNGYRWSNKIEVIIENHKIIEIRIIDDMTFKRDEVSNELFDQVIEEQSLEVDGVSEATISCNAYLKAIEDALDED
ncbi:FMN-binding protein [Mycoplasmatota bacterium]|nr:FMN-binding protein [Mycoplasmatota bacterium]